MGTAPQKAKIRKGSRLFLELHLSSHQGLPGCAQIHSRQRVKRGPQTCNSQSAQGVTRVLLSQGKRSLENLVRPVQDPRPPTLVQGLPHGSQQIAQRTPAPSHLCPPASGSTCHPGGRSSTSSASSRVPIPDSGTSSLPLVTASSGQGTPAKPLILHPWNSLLRGGAVRTKRGVCKALSASVHRLVTP